MPNRVYTTIETLPNARAISLSSQLAIYKNPDSFALNLSSADALFWNAINPPLSAQIDNLSATAYPAISALMPLSGGELTNFLSLNTAVPLVTAHLATKIYVDNADDARLLRSGGAITGFLSAHADPNTADEVARKQYVDSRDASIDYIIGVNFSGFKTSKFAFDERNQAVDNGYASKFFVVDNSNRLKFIGSDGETYAGGGTGPFNQRFTTNICSIPFLSSGEYAISAIGDGGFCIALSNFGNVYTTGSNSSGQLGNSTTTARYTWGVIDPTHFNNVPIAKIFLSDASSTANSKTGILALTLSGDLYGWGANDNYQLSLSAASYYTTPRLINTPSNTHGGSIKNVKIKDALLTGNGESLAQFAVVIDQNNQVHAVGNANAVLPIGSTTGGITTSFSACKVSVSFGSPEINLTADAIYGSGSSNVYAITAGQLYAAGDNLNGQLLNGLNGAAVKKFTKCQLATSVNIDGNATGGQTFANNVAFVKTIPGDNNRGRYTTVYIVTNTGQVYCGGYNRVASGHARSIASRSKFLKAAIPVASLAGKHIVNLKACNSKFDFSVCIAQDSNYNLYAAGYNAYGACGNGSIVTTDGFSQVIAPNNVAWSDFIVLCSSIQTGDKDVHAHAYTTSGELYSWGYSGLGECGLTLQYGIGNASTNVAISTPVKTSIA